jgi:hypothetical protein
MGSREAAARPILGRCGMACMASLAAMTLLVVGLVPVNEAIARPASGSVAMDTAPTAPTVEVPSTLMAAAAELPGVAQTVALTATAVFVQITGQAGPQVLWRDRAGGEWSSNWGGTELTGELIAAENDVVHLRQSENEVLAWTRDGGGSRIVPTGTTLGRGALYIGYLDSEGDTALQAVTVAGDLPMPVQQAGPGDDGIAIVGDDVVSLSGTFARVYDIPTARGIASEYVCSSADRNDTSLAGFGSRLIAASCGSSGAISVADRREVYEMLTPAGSLQRGFVTGEAFALGLSTATGDLTVVPALSGVTSDASGTLGSATSFDLDDAATTVAFVESTGDLRQADLSGWSSELATEIVDTTAPSVTYPEVDGDWADFVLAERNYRVFAQGRDMGTYPFRPIGPGTGELRYRQKLAGRTSFSAYVSIGSVSASVTHPAGSTTCWSNRLVDGAGNQSGWGPEECVTIDGTRPTVTTTALPAQTKATGTATPITFKYSATDNARVASYDVRYHKDKGGTQIGSWVYPRSGSGITARSFTVGTGKSYRVCFSVRPRDAAGNTASWSPSRCTYVDGVAPKVTKAVLSSRWLTPITSDLLSWSPRFSYAASDDRGVAAYQLQHRSAGTRGRLTQPGTYQWGEIPGRSTTDGLNPGDQSCWRVRAKDAVGNVSEWSAWRCVNAPFPSWGSYLEAASTGNFGFVVSDRSPAWTSEDVAVRSVRIKVKTGPMYGAMKVYADSEYLGTVNARASSIGAKWMTLTTSSSTVKTAKVRFVATSSAYVRVKAVYFVR